MLDTIATIVISLAMQGYLLRGAVTVGQLYHEGRLVVGPAMVCAVEMESKIAIVPRVIVAPEVIGLARRYPREGHSEDKEEEYVRSFIRTDDDGKLFIDYVSWKSVVEVAGAQDNQYPAYLKSLGCMIKAGLEHKDERVTAKYLWLHTHYVNVLKNFAAMSKCHLYRSQSPQCYKSIVALSRFKKLARKAKRRVKKYEKNTRLK